jgi:hypothetical protein
MLLQAGRLEFDSRLWGRDFSPLHSFQTSCGAHPASYPMITGKEAFSSGVKRLRHEADDSPPSTFEVMNGGAIPPLHHTS